MPAPGPSPWRNRMGGSEQEGQGMPCPQQAAGTPCSVSCLAHLPFSFPLLCAPHPESGPAYQNAQTTGAACSPMSPWRHRRGACLLSTPLGPPPRAVEDPSASGTWTESVPGGSRLRPCQEDSETPAAQGQHLAPGLQSARRHFRIFPRKTAVELGIHRVSQPRKGP